jgi:hypothetical protein
MQPTQPPGSLSAAGRRESVDYCRGVVRLHPPLPFVAQQRPVAALTHGGVDGLLGARVENYFGGLVACADDPQGRLIPGAAQIRHVRPARFRDPQPVKREQAGQRVDVATFVFSCCEQVG